MSRPTLEGRGMTASLALALALGALLPGCNPPTTGGTIAAQKHQRQRRIR